MNVDEKILDKFKRNQQYIDTLNSNDEAIAESLPQAQANQFV